MGLLKPASNQTAYLKLGTLGFEGSGKTYLSVQFAMGLANLTGVKKVAFFDTEKGSDFYVKKFEKAGIQLDVLRSRTFVDLLSVIREAETGGYAFLIIDSITHVWRELGQAYQQKTGKKRLTMQDWMILKTEWSQFTDLYVNSKLHIGMCGRAGYEYDFDEDEDGKKEIIKTGTKMKAEGETGFEPDLLIETFKVPLAETLTNKKAKKGAKGFVNRCCVVKDRSDLMNGKVLDKPKFEDFLPIIKTLNLGGTHVGTQPANSSQALFQSPERSVHERMKRVEIMLEKIKEAMILTGLDGTANEVKKRRAEELIKVFGTSAWTEISNMSLEQLTDGVWKLRLNLGIDKPADAAEDDIPFQAAQAATAEATA